MLPGLQACQTLSSQCNLKGMKVVPAKRKLVPIFEHDFIYDRVLWLEAKLYPPQEWTVGQQATY